MDFFLCTEKHKEFDLIKLNAVSEARKTRSYFDSHMTFCDHVKLCSLTFNTTGGGVKLHFQRSDSVGLQVRDFDQSQQIKACNHIIGLGFPNHSIENNYFSLFSHADSFCLICSNIRV